MEVICSVAVPLGLVDGPAGDEEDVVGILLGHLWMISHNTTTTTSKWQPLPPWIDYTCSDLPM